MLLPAMPQGSHALVAIDGAHGLVVGAAALTGVMRPLPLPGPGLMIHTIPPCRGQGVASALCKSAAAVARTQAAQALYAAQRVEFDGPEMEAWRRLGFEVCETVEEHEAPVAQFELRLAPLMERFRREGRIPDGAKIVPLYAANRDEVLQLHLTAMGGDRASLARKLSGQGSGAFHLRLSRVLLVDERVVGCVLAHRTSQSAFTVDATIVAPELRGGWANVWLKLEASRGAPPGVTHFHYTSFDHYTDTRRFTEKLGGVTTLRQALMYRPL